MTVLTCRSHLVASLIGAILSVGSALAAPLTDEHRSASALSISVSQHVNRISRQIDGDLLKVPGYSYSDKDFAELEAMAETMRSAKTRLPGGGWALQLFYGSVEDAGVAPTKGDRVERKADIVQRWQKAVVSQVF